MVIITEAIMVITMGMKEGNKPNSYQVGMRDATYEGKERG